MAGRLAAGESGGAWSGTLGFRWSGAVLVALVGLILAGVLVAGDYSMGLDEPFQRRLGHYWLDHLLGDAAAIWEGRGIPANVYGAALEVPLALIERALGLQDSRDIYVARHVLTHLFFLAGGFCAALLAHRLFGGGWPALVALAAFVLHPRLYAHSFSNTKDGLFAALFMVCLYLTHRAFRRDAAGAFALLGVAVGLLVNQRVMGVLLAVLVVAARILDMMLASGWAARRQTLVTAAAFVAVAFTTLYAVSPHLWSNPLVFGDLRFFQGELVRWPAVPASYIPTWVAITTPPALLALSLVGAGTALAGGFGAPRRWLCAGQPRFALMLVACIALAVLGVVAMGVNVNSGWRHLHFLWAPASVLAVFGLRWLAGAGRRPVQRRGVHALAALGVAAGAAQLVLMHPHQAVYFNWLVDRDTPERLRVSHAMDYWQVTYRQALERALDRHPTATVTGADPKRARIGRRQRLILAEAERRRVIDGPPPAAGFVIGRPPVGPTWGLAWAGEYVAPVAHAVKVYDNTLTAAFALDPSLLGEAAARTHRAEYAAVAGAPVAHSAFDLHLRPRELTWRKAPCGPTDVRGEFTLTARPAHGAERTLAFGFAQRGVRVGDACMVRMPLPAGALAAIEVGQRLRNGPDLWRVAIDHSTAGAAAADVTRPAVSGERVARSHFDLYIDGASVTYVREACRPQDTWTPFFLHVFPVDPAAIRANRRVSGFDNLDFTMERYDERLIERLQGRCITSIQLPDYPIAQLRTGLQGRSKGVTWTVALRRPVRLSRSRPAW